MNGAATITPTLAAAHAARIARHRKWEAAARKAMQARQIEARPDTVPHAPVERVWAEHDDHKRAWLEWKTNEPVGYLKMRCRQLDVDYRLIVGPTRQSDIVRHRHALIVEIRDRYRKSLPELGRLFNRDHTSILAVVRKGPDGYAPAGRAVVDRARIIALHNAGFSQKEIAKRVGCCASAVSRTLIAHFPASAKTRLMKDHADEIRALFAAGRTFADIAHATGFDPSAISKFVRKKGWTR